MSRGLGDVYKRQAGNLQRAESVSPSWIPIDLCIQLSAANLVPYVATTFVLVASFP